MKGESDGRFEGLPAGASFTIVEHMADWALSVQAPDFGRLLVAAAWGMNSLMTAEPGRVPLEETRELSLEAFDRESMLVEWLSELAYLAEVEGLVFRLFRMNRVTPELVEAVVSGGRVAILQKHIKAVTYHNLQVVESEGSLDTTIVFDV